MKVLLQNPILPPYRLAFFRSLSRAPDVDLHLAYGQSQCGTALDSVKNPENLNVHYLHNLYIGGIPPRITIQSKFPSLIREVQPDVVIASYDPRFPMNLIGNRISRRMGIKWIWWGHGIRPRDRFLSIYKRMANMADAILLYGEPAKAKLALLGVPAEKLFVAWNSIDTTEIDKFANPVPFNQRFRLLYVGRLIHEKKIDLLIRAFATAYPSMPEETKLTIIGEGPDRTRLYSLCANYDIVNRVEFPGSLYSQEQLSPYINTAFLSISPGYIGLSSVHSLAYGVPLLVADDEPHSPEIAILKENINGVYFKSNSVKDLVSHLIDLSLDRDKAFKLGEAGRLDVQVRYSVEAMVRSFQDALKYVLK